MPGCWADHAIRYRRVKSEHIYNVLNSLVKIGEKFDLDQWHLVDHYTKLMYYWLPDLSDKLGKTYCLTNLVWPNHNDIKQTPQGYDTYVLTFHFEYPDFEWIKNFCDTMSSSKVLLIYPYNSCKYQIANLQIIEYESWFMILDWYQKESGWPDVDFESKTKKLSSLANRISQFRTYVNAYLCQHWDHNDFVMSRHQWLAKEQDLYLLNYTGNVKIDAIIDFIKKSSMEQVVTPHGKFLNTPLANLNYQWEAYTDCYINSTNESVSSSSLCEHGEEYLMPGPYLTEKTMKCLLSKTAVLPAGQYNTYGYLQTLGFKFDYPWSKHFDSIKPDIDRFCEFFNVLDHIQALTINEVRDSVRNSCNHNREYIISGDCVKLVTNLNESNVNKYYHI